MHGPILCKVSARHRTSTLLERKEEGKSQRAAQWEMARSSSVDTLPI